MKRKPRKSRGILKAAVAGLAVGAAAGVVVYWPRSNPDAAMPPILHTGTVVTPQGDGTCRKLVYSGDTSRVLETRTLPCESLRSSRDDLPPVLRGYQDSLRK